MALSGSEQPASGRQAVAALAEIERSEREGVYVIAVTGEIDVSNVGAVEHAACEISNETLGIVLDLSSTTYIDSATIGLMFRLRRGLSRRGQALRVICPPGSSVRRVLELTGFDRELPPEEDRDAAIAAIHEDVPLGERRRQVGSEQPEPAAGVAHEVEQGPGDDPEEERGGTGQHGD
ncbi:MAG: STAS domain-containing protein [Solirubrobacteraceae bacterium]